MIVSPVRRLVRRAVAGVRVALGQPSAFGGVRYRTSRSPLPRPVRVDVRLPATATDLDAAIRWCRRQTLRELHVVALSAEGTERWRVDRDGPVAAAAPAAFFAAPGTLPEVAASHYEAALYVLLAEETDALVDAPVDEAPVLADTTTAAARRGAVYRRDAFVHDPRDDSLAIGSARLVKWLGAEATAAGRPYVVRDVVRGSAPATLEVGLRDLELLTGADLAPRRDARPAILVTVPFLARGGAEHTLFETLRHLRDRWHVTLVTLAPHRRELGDRRADFAAEVSPHLLALGDLVHPDAMPGILLSLLERTGARLLYNANGTTLFYDFAPLLRAARPDLRIVDHLYDHRVGYVERYDRALLASVDVCVAENRRIREVLVGERGWPAERVPVVWPCGRRDDAFPAPAERDAVRHRLRGELGIAADDVVVLTAARMHPQKRPLDLVALAGRLRDVPRLSFLVVGGGELEDEVDAAIAAAAGARVRRLPFRDDVPDLLVACDVACLVSAYEGLPVFLLEALQACRPFVATDVGEVAALAARGGGVVAGPPGDLDALEAALRRLADDDRRRELAAAAARAGAEVGVAACAERYHAVFAGHEQR